MNLPWPYYDCAVPLPWYPGHLPVPPTQNTPLRVMIYYSHHTYSSAVPNAAQWEKKEMLIYCVHFLFFIIYIQSRDFPTLRISKYSSTNNLFACCCFYIYKLCFGLDGTSSNCAKVHVKCALMSLFVLPMQFVLIYFRVFILILTKVNYTHFLLIWTFFC